MLLFQWKYVNFNISNSVNHIVVFWWIVYQTNKMSFFMFKTKATCMARFHWGKWLYMVLSYIISWNQPYFVSENVLFFNENMSYLYTETRKSEAAKTTWLYVKLCLEILDVLSLSSAALALCKSNVFKWWCYPVMKLPKEGTMRSSAGFVDKMWLNWVIAV